MSHSIRIHRHPLSGHAHKVHLFASLAGIAHDLIDVDLLKGEHKQQPFLSLNPAGQVPVIEDGTTVIADSNAILIYLARKYAPDWLPREAAAEAAVQRFLSLAAGDLAFGPATARLITLFKAPLDAERAAAVSEQFLAKLETHLTERDWLVTDRPTIADVALYSYTAHAPEGNVDLSPYAHVRAWLNRIEALPGFVPMQASAVGLAA